MEHSIHILHLEDDARDAELIRHHLDTAGLACDIVRADEKASFEAALAQNAFDVILCDWCVPGYDGMAALQAARAIQPETPAIILSGVLGEEEAVEYLKAGASDYVLKQHPQRLPFAVTRALREARECRALRNAEEALRESEERFRELAERSDAVFWFYGVNPDRALYVSPAVERLWGIPAEQFYREPHTWWVAIHPDDRARVAAAHEAWIRGEAMEFEEEYRLVRPDGSLCWVHDVGTLIRDETGEVVRISGIAENITERKQQEERIARLSRIHTLLSGINSAIVRIRDREELFREACRIAVEHGGFAMAWIGLRVPGTSKVTPAVWLERDKGYLSEIGLALEGVIDDPGAAGRALREKRAIIVNDVAQDPHVAFKPEALARNFHSLAVFPLIIGQDVVGVFSLYAAVPEFFDDAEELRLLGELASDIAFALDHIQKEEALNYVAYHDVLTGLPNRSLFEERCDHFIRMTEEDQPTLAIMLMDLVRFRHVNDTLGRHVGDALIRLMGERLKAAVPESAELARIHADCFALMVTGVHGEVDAARLFDEVITETVGRKIELGGNEYRLSARAGIAIFPIDGRDAETLLKNAEEALRGAKRTGERYLFYAPQMNAKVSEKLSLESKLRRALEREQFVLYYQPKFDAQTKAVSGLEALIRWSDPESGLVPPAQFIPLLEETGMILEVGQWALERALSDLREWQAQGLQPRIAVNVSAIQLRQKEFADKVGKIVDRHVRSGAPSGGGLDLELTESLIMDDIEGNIGKLQALREMGIGIHVDDFGTGYSSLNYIARLPISALKIDRLFVNNMTGSPDDMTIVYTIISLAHALRMQVVAEGVETVEQYNLLRLLRCDEVQGFLFSPPVPKDRLAWAADPTDWPSRNPQRRP